MTGGAAEGGAEQEGSSSSTGGSGEDIGVGYAWTAERGDREVPLVLSVRCDSPET